ncbi:hypothetical protein GCM10023349_11300 [Nocardioides conyzicola]|uniref:Uncharacterized protein n=1 Tax=Nocardioides conyzicola TaxID=1651781 RepID=A0ABP8WXK5_9ACTN
MGSSTSKVTGPKMTTNSTKRHHGVGAGWRGAVWISMVLAFRDTRGNGGGPAGPALPQAALDRQVRPAERSSGASPQIAHASARVWSDHDHPRSPQVRGGHRHPGTASGLLSPVGPTSSVVVFLRSCQPSETSVLTQE